MQLPNPVRRYRFHISPLPSLRAIFFLNGFLFASWVPLIPYIAHHYHLSPATLGYLLAALTLGAVVGLLGVNWASRLVSQAWIFTGSLLGAAAGLATIGSLPGLAWLIISILIFGAALGVMDVAMNRAGSLAEEILARPLLPGLHAFFSFGGAAGGICSGALLMLGAAPGAAALAAAAIALIGVPAALSPPPVKVEAGAASGPSMAFGPVKYLVLLAFCALATEGVMIDWIGIYLTHEFGLARAPASGGYILFALALTASRLCGNKLVQRFGAVTVLTAGGLLAIFGVTSLALAPGRVVVALAILAAGFGLGNVAPLLFSLAGKIRVIPATAAISAVVTAGYAGFMAAPPVMGGLVQGVGFRAAYVCFAVAVLLALWLWRRQTVV